MKNTAALLLTLFVFFTGYGQAQPKKIRIVLLGTFHFNQSLDSNSKIHSNLFSVKRQAEINDIVSRLVSFGPTKIFVEQEPEQQPYWDSLYSNYKKGSEPAVTKLKANEIFQLGIKAAGRLHLPGVTCVDFQPENYGAKNFHPAYAMESTIKRVWDEIDAYKDSVRTNAVFFDKAYPGKRPRPDSLLQKLTLKDYILQMNTPEAYAYYTWSDWNFLYSVGKRDEYIGVDWLANFWYGRNLRIYTNILRQVDFKSDEKYLLIYGASHLPFIKHLFETNPFFEVVDLAGVLK